MNVPEAIRTMVPALFTSKENPLYAQAATSGRDGIPNVRTVHYRYLESKDALSFACHIESPKWRELKANPRVAGCWFHPKKQIQLRWNAKVSLITDPADPAVAASWDGTHDWIQNEYGDRTVFGVVVLDINAWDFYEIDLENPSNNRRRAWVRDGRAWREEARQTLK